MQTLNFIACAVLFAVSSWAVLSPHFDDGILMKKGLIVAALTSLAALVHYFEPGYAVDPLMALTNAAFAIVVISIIRRRIIRKIWGIYERVTYLHPATPAVHAKGNKRRAA